MKQATLHHAFPIVAAAIGNQFRIQVKVGGDKAFTDGKTIQLPAYDGNDPDYQDFAWGLLAHEAAHIRYSDFNLSFGDSALLRRLSGALEDVRIEYALAKDFPGTRITLRTVIEKMIAQGGFVASRIEDHPANILYGYVLKSLRSRVLGQTALKPLVEQTEVVLKAIFPQGAVMRLQDLLAEVPFGLKSERDCLDLATRILTMIQEEVEQEKNQQQQNQQQRQDDQDEYEQQRREDEQPQSNSANGSESSDQANQDNSDDQEGNTDDASGDDETVSDESASEDNATDDSGDSSDLDPGELGEATNQSGSGSDKSEVETENNRVTAQTVTTRPDPSQMLEALLSALDADMDQDVFETIKSILTLEQDRVLDRVMPVAEEPYFYERRGLALFDKVKSESLKIRVALQGLVQSQNINRIKPSHRGRINGKRLHRLTCGEIKVFQRGVIKPVPNTALHVLVDKSLSMDYPMQDSQGNALGSRMPIALEASLALALALEGLSGVNPGITAFPGEDVDTVYTLLRHGQRVKPRAGAFTLDPSGTTPLTEAIWYGASALLGCPEPRKVLMVISDGQPDCQISALEILQRCRASGIETVGIGLGIEVSHLFPVSIMIQDFRDLRGQLFELSRKVLLAG